MTPAEIAAYTGAVPTVRVSCYQCRYTLYVGEDVPDGGAEAVFQAAGCHDDPPTCPGLNPGGYDTPPPALPAFMDGA